MQVRYKNIPTDFEFENPETYLREDESDDTIFYKQPSLTTHIDAKCHENLMMLYEKLLPKEGKILGLMSGYQSHIPEDNNSFVVGLGLNEEEMKLNPRLNDFIINKDPRLPFNDEKFDAVVCDLSIEYVIKPFDLIREVNRILKKDGVFTVSFSNRYFPSKVIKLWTDLHDFERMGYVLEILLRVQGFKDIKTFSARGFRRPLDDKYFGCTFFSDPLYLVYAKKEILINNS
ncbi:MAG: methyltransferase domain-containing protein [Thermodesulfovibrio sp.]|nr:methyltransferase domain-containing protein [Thermodesulfovibrio sp.]